MKGGCEATLNKVQEADGFTASGHIGLLPRPDVLLSNVEAYVFC